MLKTKLLKITPFLTIIISLAGCEIQESEQIPAGDIAVSAVDSTGNELTGGKIFLDAIETGQFTPDTLENIPVGGHLIKVKVHGYEAAQESIAVLENQLAEIEFTLAPAQFGFLKVISVPPGAGIILDLALLGWQNPLEFLEVETGLHTVSVFIDGYLTLEPSLDSVIVTPEDTAEVSFTLQPGENGGGLGDIAYDFTLDDDLGNAISLHNYRGYIVLLTFFYTECQPCMQEFPEINQLFLDYAQYGVQVLGIDPMYYDDVEDVIAMRENLNIGFKLLLDEGAVYNQMYDLIAYPTNIVVAPTGEIAARMYGTTYEELAEIFDLILGLQ